MKSYPKLSLNCCLRPRSAEVLIRLFIGGETDLTYSDPSVSHTVVVIAVVVVVVKVEGIIY